MKIAPQTLPPPAATTLKTNTPNELNPAKQAKAADPSAKGAAFGHAVADAAHARNAARFAAKHGVAPPLTPPIVEAPPAVETPPTEETPPVGETPPAEETPPTGTASPVDPTVETPPTVEAEAPTVLAPALAVETKLLADLAASIAAEPGDTLDILA